MEPESKKGAHGGKRAGAGRRRSITVSQHYKLEPHVVHWIKEIAKANHQTESSLANHFLAVVIENANFIARTDQLSVSDAVNRFLKRITKMRNLYKP